MCGYLAAPPPNLHPPVYQRQLHYLQFPRKSGREGISTFAGRPVGGEAALQPLVSLSVLTLPQLVQVLLGGEEANVPKRERAPL